MGSTNLPVRTVLQYALAGEKESVNHPDVKNQASRLDHLLEIYGRLQVLRSCFTWHQSNANDISFDSLAILKNDVESLGNYTKEHEKKFTSNEFIDQIRDFNKETREYAEKQHPWKRKTYNPKVH
jgi:tRNA A37 N6-isopentenylltransferase MiaA